ncbi:hypothetical protein BT63DRAFT_425074 [Microthyrium microscopicum]|uniref:Amino acid transporter transmembrane domain-containing protein n=1 Tax=Microthyrium microscopicum TaxID=703497 RepID=A0A6A6UE25_9PEZI|nr:hypothetical protein BT63DRAFT_425074 [Microthyrium microscopicum]
MSTPGKQPSTWQNYESGGRAGSPGSIGSRVQWDESQSPPRHGQPSRTSSTSHQGDDDDRLHVLRRRRSSFNVKINQLRQIGGVNSIDNFAQSWQRAAGFHEIAPIRPSFRFANDEEGEPSYLKSDIENSPDASRSLLRQALEEGRRGSDNVIDESRGGEGEVTPTEETPLRASSSRIGRVPPSWTDSIFAVEPSLASGFGGSYGTMYGSRQARPRQPSMVHAAQIFNEEQVKNITGAEVEPELEPLVLKQVEEDGVVYNVVVGRSTLPQTVFNSINVLIGVGLLSMPLGLLYSGWVIGIVFFFFAVLSTQYTAKLLAKCLDVDNSLVTFADLAYVSFGPRARIATSILFSLELIAACVALIILFADSLNALLPGWSVLAWKLFCGILLIPLSFLPLRLLSFTSVLGILSCLGIFLAVVTDGILKPETPGSLRAPATTYLFPQRWQTVPLAFGLLMSPWGGHSVFPNIYRDMRHPYKYRRAVNITYIFTGALDLGMAVIGLLMFGDGVHDEITSNILLLGDAYPPGLSLFIVICIAIIPLTKVPLNARPIVTTVEVIFGLVDYGNMSHGHGSEEEGNSSRFSFGANLARVLIRVGIVVVFVVIAMLFPSFDRIMTLLGSVCCFSICIMLPVGFHLRLFGHEFGKSEKMLNWGLLIASTIMAVVSTVFACLPREVLSGKAQRA